MKPHTTHFDDCGCLTQHLSDMEKAAEALKKMCEFEEDENGKLYKEIAGLEKSLAEAKERAEAYREVAVSLMDKFHEAYWKEKLKVDHAAEDVVEIAQKILTRKGKSSQVEDK